MSMYETSEAMVADMAGASREALVRSLEVLEVAQPAVTLDSARQFCEFVNLVHDNTALLRALTDPAGGSKRRDTLLSKLFKDRIPEESYEILAGMVALKWSVPEDLLTAVEVVAVNIVFYDTERVKEGQGLPGFAELETLAKNIMEFRHLLINNSQIVQAFENPRAEVAAKRKLLYNLLRGSEEATQLLLAQTVLYPRGIKVTERVNKLLALLTVRQQCWIAEVTTGAPFDDAQKERLRNSLSELYGRRLKLDVFLDESLLGGFKAKIGDEVLDASIAARIRRMQRQLENMV